MNMHKHMQLTSGPGLDGESTRICHWRIYILYGLQDQDASLCGVFLCSAAQLGSREKDMAAKCGFARSAPQKAMRIWKHGAGMTTTHHGNLASWVERFQSSGSESLHEMRTGQCYDDSSVGCCFSFPATIHKYTRIR